MVVGELGRSQGTGLVPQRAGSYKINSSFLLALISSLQHICILHMFMSHHQNPSTKGFLLFWVFFSCCYDKTLWQKQLKGEKMYLARNVRVQFITAGCSGQQEHEAAGCDASWVRSREQWINAYTLTVLSLLSLLSLGDESALPAYEFASTIPLKPCWVPCPSAWYYTQSFGAQTTEFGAMEPTHWCLV